MNEVIGPIAVLLGVVVILFGGLLGAQVLKNDCIALVKDKPAIEIQAICR